MNARRILKWPSLPSLILFLVIVVINSFVSKNFMSLNAWTSFLQTTTPVILIAIGMAVVMLGGGIDLSLGAVVSVVNVIMVTTSGGFKDIGLQYEANIVSVPLILSFVVAIGFGFFNGLLISVLRINPLLATFASSFVGSGVALTILPTPGGAVAEALGNLYYTNLFGFLPSCLLLIAFLYLIWYVLTRTPLRLYLYSVGNSASKAFFSGVKVPQVVFFTYIFSAFTAWLAGVAISSDFGGGDPRIGSAMTLSAVAACVIGGVSLSGGVGSASGGIFGALFLNLILITVLGLGIPGYLQELVSGLIVVASLVLAVAISLRAQKLRSV
jgi:ribose transport system permease protein